MILTIHIELDGAAFDGCEGWEAARILRVFSQRLKRGEIEIADNAYCRAPDLNGNYCADLLVWDQFKKAYANG
jgi:hypothetical protein